jgi:hypothetical protein
MGGSVAGGWGWQWQGGRRKNGGDWSSIEGDMSKFRNLWQWQWQWQGGSRIGSDSMTVAMEWQCQSGSRWQEKKNGVD